MSAILFLDHHARLSLHPLKQVDFHIQKPACFLLKNGDAVFVHVISLNVAPFPRPTNYGRAVSVERQNSSILISQHRAEDLLPTRDR
ncbi:hypothetical protein D9M71_586730 [compost metagenome]